MRVQTWIHLGKNNYYNYAISKLFLINFFLAETDDVGGTCYAKCLINFRETKNLISMHFMQEEEESITFAGGGPHVLTQRELSYSTLGGQLGLTSSSEDQGLITSV